MPALRVDQVKRAVPHICDGEVNAIPFLEIALERSTPKLPALDKIVFDIEEVKAAVESIMRLCGLK